MRSQLLRHADWAGMSRSLEVRVPYVDVKLLKTLAPLLLMAVKPKKEDMARSVKVPLPEGIFTRHKTGFYIPLNRLLNDREKRVSKRSGFRQWARHVHASFSGQPGHDG
jgi:asparagine synthase (glutamine-hydrolysing)